MPIEPVVIKSVNDIHKVIAIFKTKSHKSSTKLNTEIEWVDDSTKNKQRYKTTVTANVDDIDIKEIIINGLNAVKNQVKVWDNLRKALVDDEYSTELPRFDVNKMHSPVDAFIKHRLGGVREGTNIVWVLKNKKYVFNPFTNELKEESNA